MADVPGVQPARDQAGGGYRSRMAILGLPPWRVRPAGQRRFHEGRPAPGRGDRLQPVTRAPDQGVVPRVGLVHDPKRHLDGQRLAAGGAAVGLEGVPEPAVVVAVGGHRVPHRLGGAVAEQPLEPAPVEDPRVRGDEGSRGIKVRSVHPAITARPGRPVLNETATVVASFGGLNRVGVRWRRIPGSPPGR